MVFKPHGHEHLYEVMTEIEIEGNDYLFRYSVTSSQMAKEETGKALVKYLDLKLDDFLHNINAHGLDSEKNLLIPILKRL